MQHLRLQDFSLSLWVLLLLMYLFSSRDGLGLGLRLRVSCPLFTKSFFSIWGGVFLFHLLGKTPFSLHGILDVFQFTPKDWFIKAYLLLMIIAPVLNSFCQNAEEKTQRYIVIGFLLFEVILGWIGGARNFYNYGYGPLHFIGLYILAQYVHNQLSQSTTPKMIKQVFSMSKFADLLIFLLTVVLNTSMVCYISRRIGLVNTIYNVTYAYNNPLVILGSLYLLLFFSKIRMPYVKVINWFGASSFAVYLFHSETTVRKLLFTPQVQYLYDTYSEIMCVGMICLFLCFVYILSVLLDQLRIVSWNCLWKFFENKDLCMN